MTFSQAEGIQTKNNIWYPGSSEIASNFDVTIAYESVSAGSGIFGSTGHTHPNGIKGTEITGPGDLSKGYGIHGYPTGGAYIWTADGYPLNLAMTSNINKGAYVTDDFNAHTASPTDRPPLT